MRVKRVKQVAGSRKEMPLESVGNESYGTEKAQIYVPTDAEYAYYGELLQGYFTHLVRWQGIFKEFQKEIDILPPPKKYSSQFFVEQTAEGSVIRSGEDLPSSRKHFENVVLIAHTTNSGNISKDSFLSDISFYFPKSPRIPPIVGADGGSIRRVEIIDNIWSYSISEDAPEADISVSSRTLSIFASPRNFHNPIGKEDIRSVVYKFEDNAIQARRGTSHTRSMKDAYAIHLFHTIDALIPGTIGSIPQTSRRTIPETQLPMAQPAPRRRPAGR